MASVHPRTTRDGSITSYQVRFRLGGGRAAPVQTETFDEQDQAAEFKRLVDEAGQRWPVGWVKGEGLVSPGDSVPLSYRFEDYARTVIDERTGVEPGTRRAMHRNAELWLFPTFGHCDIRSAEDFSKGSVRRWIIWLAQQEVVRGPRARVNPAKAKRHPMSPGTIIKQFRLLSMILGEATEHEPPLRDRNPCRSVTLPRADNETADNAQFMTPQQVALLIGCFTKRSDQLLCTIQYGTGLRWGEISALQPQDIIGIDTARPQLRVQRAWKKQKDGSFKLGAPKSRRSRRTFRISPTVVEALRELGVGKLGQEQLLWTAEDGKSRLTYGTFSQRWHRALIIAHMQGLEISPTGHDLRHSHAAALISAGQPLTAVQRRLGHESIMTTSDLYGHLLPELEEDAIDAIEVALAGRRPPLRSVG